MFNRVYLNIVPANSATARTDAISFASQKSDSCVLSQ